MIMLTGLKIAQPCFFVHNFVYGTTPKILLYACSYIIIKWFCMYSFYKIHGFVNLSDTFYLELMALNFTKLLK